jgi:rhamnose utilization protein RhaD (predicted bifunctional aldolase and dehydrogenase)
MMAVLRADKLGGYESISLEDSFAMEYWELEQAKLKK